MKKIDRKFEKIGFKKIEENEYGVTYQRHNTTFIYTQILDLCFKQSGYHIVQSYDAALRDNKNIGNTCVGLTMYELKLCYKKMRSMGWKPKKYSKNLIDEISGSIMQQ